jgi:hypothetical protein
VFDGQRRRPAKHRPDQRVIRRRQVVERGDVLFRDEQHVQRRLGVDVLEYQQVVVFEDDLGGNLPRNDSAEEAVGHVITSAA